MSKWDDKTTQSQKTFKFFTQGIKTLWELLGNERKKIMVVLFWMLFITIIDLSFSFLLKLIFDEIPNLKEIGTISNYFLFLIGSILALRIGTLYLDRFSLEMRFLKSLIKLENFWPAIAQKKLLELSLGYHEKENTGKKIAKITKGCDQLTHILASLRWGLLPPIFFITINVIIIFVLDWRLGILFVFPLFPASWLYLKAFRKAAPVFEEWDKNKEIATGLFTQSIINVQTVQNYVQEKKEIENFSKIREHMAKTDIQASSMMQKYLFGAMIMLHLFFTLTILFSLYLLLTDQNTLGTIVYILSTGSVTSSMIWRIIHEYTEILRKMISVERMKELLDEKPDVTNSKNPIRPKEFIGNIKIDNISFKYPRKKQAVMDGIDFEIKPGEMIAFVGKSGEGKTTIVRLICRMYDITDGKILLDGKNIKDLDLFWYRKNFSIVQQDVDIFDDTIENNIKYAYPNASKKEVLQAISSAHLDTTVNDKNRFPEGLNTEVGERGVRLSGGERQRVGIARAFLSLMKGAKILILDEATSSLDSQAERAIQDMINDIRAKENVTIIAIAHRLSTIQKSDHIYVISKGKIAEKGSHDELVKEGGIYAKLVKLQQLGEIRD